MTVCSICLGSTECSSSSGPVHVPGYIGRWVYLIAEDRKSGYRWTVRTKRRNPCDVEVLEGLKEGDWIISSGYDAYNEIDTRLFPEPVQLDE